MSDQDFIVESNPSDLISIPSNRDAEEALIGSILINPEVFNEVAHFLESDDFYIMRNKWIYEAFRKLSSDRVPFDLLTVSETLAGMGHLEEIGGVNYLAGLASQVPSSLHAEAYGRIIEGNAVRRRMIAAANDIAKMAYRQDQPIDMMVDEAEKTIFSVSEKRNRRDLIEIKQVLNDFYDGFISRQAQGGQILGVPTGLRPLDVLLGGLQKSDFLIVAGRPGMGKTGFLIGALRHAAVEQKKHVAMFTLEMSNEQLVQRLIAQETGINSKRLRSNDVKDEDLPKIMQAMSNLENAVIYLDDTPAITPLQMRTKCRRLDSEIKLDLVIVDYLQLMSSDSRTDNRVQEVSQISRNLKVLARELKVPVLAAAQLSRAVEQSQVKTPVLSDLRESGSLEQDADIVIFINRPDMMATSAVEQEKTSLIVAKHRNGPTHSGLEVVFNPELAMFTNPAYQPGDAPSYG
jgi:replicative DNA helicase